MSNPETLIREIPEVIANGCMGPYYITKREQQFRRNIVWKGKTVVLQPLHDGDASCGW